MAQLGSTNIYGDLTVSKNLKIDKDYLTIDGAVVTATASELNTLDGITATTTELNKLSGFVGAYTDLNYAKDLKATGVTTTEFGMLDGIISNIQAQFDNFAASNSSTIIKRADYVLASPVSVIDIPASLEFNSANDALIIFENYIYLLRKGTDYIVNSSSSIETTGANFIAGEYNFVVFKNIQQEESLPSDISTHIAVTNPHSSTMDNTANRLVLRGNNGEFSAGAITCSAINLSGTFKLSDVVVTATASELNIADGLTVTTTELNKLDGLTVTATELNTLSGLTASTSELNKLDGFTGAYTDLNYAKDLKATGVTTTEFGILSGLTTSTTELNYVDGVTSNIQTQLNGKLPSDGNAATATLAANSTLAGGLAISTSDRNNVANQIVRTNSSGYARFGWINTTSGIASGTPTRIYCSQDDYLRYYSPASLAPYILNQGSTKNSHTHSYLPLTGGTVTGTLSLNRIGSRGTEIYIGAGEALGSMSGSAEAVYIAGENGVIISSSSDNLTSGLNHTTTLIDSSGNATFCGHITGTAVYGAVGNDIVDWIEAPNNWKYGYAHIVNNNYYGIPSDTYSVAAGTETKDKMPRAIAGFILCYVDNIYKVNTKLTYKKNGILTKKRWWMRKPIIAEYYMQIKSNKWNEVQVNGRHIVRVVK